MSLISRARRSVRALLQRFVVRLAFRWPGTLRDGASISWVIGPNEVASMVAQIAETVPGSFSALIVRHPYYAGPYDYQPPSGEGGARARWRLRVTNAWLFGRLARRARGFVYLSQNGYLSEQHDDRRFEFSFLKRHGVKLVCFFTGSDIRSPALMAKHEAETGLPNSSSYQHYTNPEFTTRAYDDSRRRLAEIADEFADLILTMRVDQSSYLTRDTLPFIYFTPDDEIAGTFEKFDDLERPVVLHAPSSPITKGTQLVRAAVDALHRKGLDFEYVELSDVPHEEVKHALARAHVVLNQFYAHVPGVFGVEAMAAGCVMLTSADEHIEPDLPRGSNEAWTVTKHFEVAERLEEVLSNPVQMRAQAEAGVRWVREHAAAGRSGERLRMLLAEIESGDLGARTARGDSQ